MENAFPAEYRGNLFFGEWGRAVVRYRPERAGSGFGPIQEIEFAAAAQNDPYGFKPTDLVVERDGSLMVADWADGQRPKRGRGRIYRIQLAARAQTGAPERQGTAAEPPNPSEGTSQRGGWSVNAGGFDHSIAHLDSESYYQRIEAQAAIERNGRKGVAALRNALRKGHLGVRARLHAVWILTSAGGESSVADLVRLAASDRDPRVRGQAIRAVADLADPVLAEHRLAAGPGDAALARRLAALGARENDPRVFLEVVVALGRLQWRSTPAWLERTLRKPDSALSHAAMQALRRSENWPAILKLLDEPKSHPIRAIAVRALADRFQPVVVDGLIDRLRRETGSTQRHDYADLLTRVHRKLAPWVYWGYRTPPRPAPSVAWQKTPAIEQALDRVLADPDRVVRLAVLRRMQREKIPARPGALADWLREERDEKPAAAILLSLQDHPADQVRHTLQSVVVDMARDADFTLRRASLDSLRLLKEPRVVPLAMAALAHRETQLAALDCLRELGGPPQLKPVIDMALRDPAADLLASVVRLLAKWSGDHPEETAKLNRAAAELQGASGVLMRWRTTGPMSGDAAGSMAQQLAARLLSPEEPDGLTPPWHTSIASGAELRVSMGASQASAGRTVWLAYTDFVVSDPMSAQFLGSSRGTLRVWLNGQLAHQRDQARSFASGSDRFDGNLRSGRNHLLIEMNSANLAEFSLSFRRKSAVAGHEQFAQAALSRSGNVARGRKLFFNVEKLQCLKCHRLADQGEGIGPELTGVGSRFSRVHIIESILEPSRSIVPSFQSTDLLLRDGRELSGVLISEQDGSITLADNQGRKLTVAKPDIQEQRTGTLSLMPEGLEKAFTPEEFIDLVEFLVSQKPTRAP